MGKFKNKIPNVPKYQSQFYPKQTPSNSQNVNNYSNPNIATDRYFNERTFEKTVAETPNKQVSFQKINSLSGKSVDPKDFKHNKKASNPKNCPNS